MDTEIVTPEQELVGEAMNRANEHLRSCRFTEGIAILTDVLTKITDKDLIWKINFNIGSLYSTWGQFEKAHEHFIIAESGGCDVLPMLYHNIGLNFKRSGQYKKAIKWYRKGLEKDPSNPNLHNNLGNCLLLIGELEEGYKEWEWRLLAHPHSRNVRKLFNKPDWDGTPGKGTILIYNEQGRGDMIQYARYLPMIKERGYKTTLIVKEDMMDIMSKCGATKILPAVESTNPTYDLVCSINSLPHIFGTTLETIPPQNMFRPKGKNPVPAKFWGQYTDKMKIGFCWAGSPGHADDIHRSVCNAHFSVLNNEDHQLFSLQKRDPRQAALVAPTFTDFVDMEPYIKTLNDVAHIIVQLDVVVTVDTSIAHLAASCGIQTFVLIPAHPDYRWGVKGNTTPWYKNMQLFRQPKVNDWNEPFNKVAKALKSLW